MIKKLKDKSDQHDLNKQGMSAKNVDSTQLACNIATNPPEGVANDLMLYIIEGKVRHEFERHRSSRGFCGTGCCSSP